jgi:hypothetical protein
MLEAFLLPKTGYYVLAKANYIIKRAKARSY